MHSREWKSSAFGYERDTEDTFGREALERFNGKLPTTAGWGVRLFLLVFGAIWMGFVGMFVRTTPRNVMDGIRRAYVWEKAKATVLSLTAPKKSQPARVRYLLTVSGAEYLEEETLPGWRAGTESTRRAWQEGDTIDVWYDPANPSDAEIDPSMSAFSLGSAMFMVPFVAAGAGTLFVAIFWPWRWVKSRLRRMELERSPPWGLLWFGIALAGTLLLYPICAFVVFGCSMLLAWRTSWTVGLILAAAVPPMSALYAGRKISRWRGKMIERMMRGDSTPWEAEGPWAR